MSMTSSARFASLAACALAGALTLAAPRAAHAGNSTAESSQVRYRQATDAYKQRKFEEARRILQGLWAEAHTYDVAVTLVQAEYQLGHYAAAANYLTFALANVPPTEKIDSAARMKKDLAQLRELAAQLQLTVSEPGAEITIDGTSVGTSPLGEFYVDDGPHTVAARLGDRTASKAFKAEKGKVASIELTLPKPASESAPPAAAAVPATQPLAPAPAQPAANDTSSPSVVPVVVGGTVFAGALIAGIALRASAGGSYKDADALRAKNGPQGCTSGTATTTDCTAQSDANSSGDSKTNISTVAFTVAGAALVGTAIYWFWPRQPTTTATASTRFLGSVTPSSAFLGISRDF